jgi:hypothetical protein
MVGSLDAKKARPAPANNIFPPVTGLTCRLRLQEPVKLSGLIQPIYLNDHAKALWIQGSRSIG